MILFFDTETTGLPDNRLPPEHPAQPHLVQLAAVLTEQDGTERASINVIVEPDGYEIPEGAAKVHGITTDMAARCGMPLASAAYAFICLRAKADILVAHNIKFDMAIMETAILRIPKREWAPGPVARCCTMERSAPIVNLPPTERMLAVGITSPKAPRLEEAYRHFFAEELVGAHDALVDVRACKRIYFEILEHGKRAA